MDKAADTLRAEIVADLRELIEALDRRLPRLAHISEPAIANDAADLRARAVRLMARLEKRPRD